jgi:hypothetical protein
VFGVWRSSVCQRRQLALVKRRVQKGSARQKRRRQRLILIEHGDHLASVPIETVHGDRPRFRIDHPELLDSGTGIFLLLIYQIKAAGLRRKNLHDKVRRTLRSFLGQNPEPFVQNNNNIWLENIDFIQTNIERRMEQLPDRVVFQITVLRALQIERSFVATPTDYGDAATPIRRHVSRLSRFRRRRAH